MSMYLDGWRRQEMKNLMKREEWSTTEEWSPTTEECSPTTEEWSRVIDERSSVIEERSPKKEDSWRNRKT
jgi:hypothetical protein